MNPSIVPIPTHRLMRQPTRESLCCGGKKSWPRDWPAVEDPVPIRSPREAGGAVGAGEALHQVQTLSGACEA